MTEVLIRFMLLALQVAMREYKIAAAIAPLGLPLKASFFCQALKDEGYFQ